MSSATAIRTRSLRVALELTDRGHHPAAGGRADVRSPLAQSDYWIELTSPPAPAGPLDLVAHPPNVVRVRARDLREAKRLRDGIRSELAANGADPDSVTVLLDVETLVAGQAASARAELAQLDSQLPGTESARPARHLDGSVTYVGTPQGLASLISDIHAAEVADGVTLLPLSLPGTLERIVSDVVPSLTARGLVFRSEQLADLVVRFGGAAVSHAFAS